MNKKTLKNTIYLEFVKFLISFFLLWIVIFISTQKFYFKNSFLDYYLYIFLYGILFLVLLIVFYFIINLIIKKHIIKEFERLKSDMAKIKSNNLSQRMSYGNFVEFNNFVSFTNSILDKLEKLIEIEKKHSLIDPLTLAYDRRGLDTEFNIIKDRAIRQKKNISFLLIDIDNFKNLNDTYGHEIGDKVLVNFTKILKSFIRKSDTLYRIGGEEFLILFYDIKNKFEEDVILRMNRQISNEMKEIVLKVKTPITFSGGFTKLNFKNLNESEILEKTIKIADELMYKAKTTGKNKIEYKKQIKVNNNYNK